jgi:hypothetical protein
MFLETLIRSCVKREPQNLFRIFQSNSSTVAYKIFLSALLYFQEPVVLNQHWDPYWVQYEYEDNETRTEH